MLQYRLHTSGEGHCASPCHPLTFGSMGMGSPDDRRRADDSCQALCVGRSMSKTPPWQAAGLMGLRRLERRPQGGVALRPFCSSAWHDCARLGGVVKRESARE